MRGSDGSITELHWAHRCVSDEDVTALSVLATGGSSLRALRKLDLERNPLLSDSGVRALGHALRDGALPALSQLWLSTSVNAPTITDEGMRDLSASLAQNRRLIKHVEPASLPPIKLRRASRVRPAARIA